MTTPRSGRRRAPTSMATACAVEAFKQELARRLHHPTPAELQQVRMHLESACKMSLDDRAPYLLAAVARTYGLVDPEARR